MDSSDSQTDDLFMPEFLNETFCNVNDEGLVQATVEVLKTGRLTPLIKEELKCTIQTRRLSEGKDELQVEFNSPEKTSVSSKSFHSYLFDTININIHFAF